MATKYDRVYKLAVQAKSGQTITIQRPFTIEFDIHRNSLSSANVASFRLYNLNPNTRSQIRKDQFDYGDLRMINFSAGYGQDTAALGFQGDITQAWSVREGSNFITQIECFDAGYAYVNALSNVSYPEGTSYQSITEDLASKIPNVTVGAIGAIPGVLSKGNAYSGNPISLLSEITGGAFFIDNGKAYVLNDDEALAGGIEVIDSSSGLLGTPVRENTIIRFDMLFEPRLKIGQRILLNSITAENYNGVYKVVSLVHRGMISDAICGDAITTVGLFFGTQELKEVG